MPLNPPKDGNGAVVPHDDHNIDPTSILIRNINPSEHVMFDENTQQNRIKSAAFSRSSGDPHYGMSVDIGQLLIEKALPEDHKVPPGMGAVKMLVGDVRD